MKALREKRDTYEIDDDEFFMSFVGFLMPSLTPPIICGFTEANTLARRKKEYRVAISSTTSSCASCSRTLSRKTTLTRHVRRLKITFNL